MKNLCRSLIWNACFLELSDESVIELESAVKALESMAYMLQQAAPQEKAAFAHECEEEANLVLKERAAGYARTAEFIRNLPESMGLL